MINPTLPIFPAFKKLELIDKPIIELITKSYPPYSDFNFTSMWSWNIKDGVCVSEFNNNLIVRFTDYLTGAPFYSFLGDKDVSNTTQRLLLLSEQEGVGQKKLRLVPADSIRNIDRNRFIIEEDRDNFDYVYSLGGLVNMEDNKLKKKRKRMQFFKKSFPHRIEILDLNNQETKDSIVDMFDNWAEDKGENLPENYFSNEHQALLRFFDIFKTGDFLSLGIYFNEKLIAISISENISGIFHLNHFQKALTSEFEGIGAYLMGELSRVLQKSTFKYLNCEQDLGLPGLRMSKESYLPSDYLKKYNVSFLSA